ncbi:MAG: SH3 domain-containing protein [Chloroflexota bacterium]
MTTENQKRQLQKAQKLLKAKKYPEARKVLEKINHPQARKWLVRLDEIAPVPEKKPNRLRGFLAGAILLVISGCCVWALTLPDPEPLPTPLPETATAQAIAAAFDAETQAAQAQTLTVAAEQTSAFETVSAELTRAFGNETATAQALSTNTPQFTATFTITSPAPTAIIREEVTYNQSRRFYTTGEANLRSCPAVSDDCEAIITLAGNVPVIVVGEAKGGEWIDSDLWYKVQYDGDEGWIHNILLTTTRPSSNVSVPSSSSSSSSGSATSSCPSISANCSALTCSQAYACLAAGNRSLDRDSDGIPCETVCGG